MTHGTSAHGGTLSRFWTDTGHDHAEGGWAIGWPQAGEWAGRLPSLAAGAVAGLILGLMLAAAMKAAKEAALDPAVLLAAGAVLAVVALWRPDWARSGPHRSRRAAENSGRASDSQAPSQLLAQMHHELRTPLNAMIGFSEVMLHELHGPLGNARYQEYAAHISESGGRLLKASEDAVAVAATMSALLAERGGLRRTRVPAAALLQDAWVASGAPRHVGWRMADGTGTVIACDPEATAQALRLLLEEASARTPAGGMITAGGRGAAEAPGVRISVHPGDRGDGCRPGPHPAAHDGVRLMLARSLLEMQGAALRLHGEPRTGDWSAEVTFPTPRAARPGGQRPRLSAACRWPGAPARRAGSPASGAARASAGSHAAPPA